MTERNTINIRTIQIDTNKNLDATVAALLRELGVPAHISGYQYLAEAVKLAVKDTSVIRGVTKVLYPSVAKTFGTTASRVERAIRHAVAVAFDRGDLEVLNNFFGNTVSMNKGTPTNSQTIAQIAEHILLAM